MKRCYLPPAADPAAALEPMSKSLNESWNELATRQTPPFLHQTTTGCGALTRCPRHARACTLALFLAWSLAAAIAAETPTTVRVSVHTDGTQATGYSAWSSISATGRYVAFASDATNLVSGDTNGKRDVFVRDRDTDGDGVLDEPGAVSTTRVSVRSDGTEANDECASPAGVVDRVPITPDGRYVAFSSKASNLVAGLQFTTWRVYVHDRESGQTTLVSIHSNGKIPKWTWECLNPAISADGRYVAFQSTDEMLIGIDSDNNGVCDEGGCDTNRRVQDIFLHDRETRQTILVSVGSDGQQGWRDSSDAAISADGRHVAFASLTTTLVQGDTNGRSDIFVRDLKAQKTIRVSVATDGTQANDFSILPFISGDGRFVGFESAATNLVPGITERATRCFVHDRDADGNGVFDEPGGVRTTCMSVAADGTPVDGTRICMSPDGRFVAFASFSPNIVVGDTNTDADIFLRDRDLDGNAVFDEVGGTRVQRVSVHTSGIERRGLSKWPSISADGRHVSFTCYAGFVDGDTNEAEDVFVRDLGGPGPGIVFKVDNLGNVYADGTYSSPAADFAEEWPISRSQTDAVSGSRPTGQARNRSALEPGDVLALGPDSGVMRAGDKGAGPVIGVHSTRPGFLAGGPLALARSSDVHVPVAVIGIVPIKVSVERGPIHAGDLLSLASEPGRAARAEAVTMGGQQFHLPGSFFAKALEPATSARTIRALLTF